MTHAGSLKEQETLKVLRKKKLKLSQLSVSATFLLNPLLELILSSASHSMHTCARVA